MILNVPGRLAAGCLLVALLCSCAFASQRRSDVNPDPVSNVQGMGSEPTVADSTGRMWYYDTIDGLLISPVSPQPFFIKTALNSTGLLGVFANAATGDTASASAFGATTADSAVLLNFRWASRAGTGGMTDTVQVFRNAPAGAPVLVTQLSAGGADVGRSPHIVIFGGPQDAWNVCLKSSASSPVHADYPMVWLGLFNFIRVGP